MPKIEKKTSTMLSLVSTVVFFVGLIAAAVILPFYIRLIAFPSGLDPFFYIIGYAVLLLAGIADWMLFQLLRLVRKGMIFTSGAVSLIRGISWCCIAAGILFAVLAFFFVICGAVAFTAVFVGLCIRVVKNAVEEAVEIKSENDLTV